MRNCIICNENKNLTREHVFPRRIIKFLNGERPDGLLYIKKEIEKSFKSIDSNTLKPRKNLCGNCNNTRSASFDNEFFRVFLESYNISREKYYDFKINFTSETINEYKHKIGISGDLSTGEGALMLLEASDKKRLYEVEERMDRNLFYAYIAKHSLCYLDRNGFNSTQELKDVFLSAKENTSLECQIYCVSTQYNFGCHNTEILNQNGNRKGFAIIISNIVIFISFEYISDFEDIS